MTDAGFVMTGALLRDARRDRGWSVGKLASLLGVDPNHVKRVEAGQRPALGMAFALEDLWSIPARSWVTRSSATTAVLSKVVSEALLNCRSRGFVRAA